MTQCEDYCRMLLAMRRMHNMAPPKGFTYVGMEDFLLDRGRLWTPAPLPTRLRFGPMKNCYWNARRLARRAPHKYRYVEGIAAGIIPVHHAWVVDAQDRVIDNTWRELGTEYFGAVVDPTTVPVLDDWQRGFPAYKWPRLTPATVVEYPAVEALRASSR